MSHEYVFMLSNHWIVLSGVGGHMGKADVGVSCGVGVCACT